MCLAVPAKLIARTGDEGIVDLRGTRLAVSLVLLPEAMTNDWLLVHAGFAIQKLDELEAAETWALLDEVEKLPVGDLARDALKEGP